MEIKKLTGKRKKTEADHIEIRRLEFLAGLYMDEYGPIVPTRCVRAMLIHGARKDKNGKQFESGLFIETSPSVEYDGPRSAQEMWEGGFAWSTPCGNQRSTIIRTRPRFEEWSITFVAELDTELVSLADYQLALARAERSVGLLDGRTIGFGRFNSEILDGVIDDTRKAKTSKA